MSVQNLREKVGSKSRRGGPEKGRTGLSLLGENDQGREVRVNITCHFPPLCHNHSLKKSGKE